MLTSQLGNSAKSCCCRKEGTSVRRFFDSRFQDYYKSKNLWVWVLEKFRRNIKELALYSRFFDPVLDWLRFRTSSTMF
jgi:hypothetical protein